MTALTMPVPQPRSRHDSNDNDNTGGHYLLKVVFPQEEANHSVIRVIVIAEAPTVWTRRQVCL